MNSTNLALERPSNEEIYEVLSLSLPRLLPQSLHHIKIPPNSGWPGLALKFREFKPTYARYELHFSRQSNNHAEYFGNGPVNLVAFYFGYNHPKELRQAWIDEMEIYRDAISSKLEKPIVLDNWGRNWAWLAMTLPSENVNLYQYSRFVSDFIQATYNPIRTALKAIGYL